MYIYIYIYIYKHTHTHTHIHTHTHTQVKDAMKSAQEMGLTGQMGQDSTKGNMGLDPQRVVDARKEASAFAAKATEAIKEGVKKMEEEEDSSFVMPDDLQAKFSKVRT